MPWKMLTDTSRIIESQALEQAIMEIPIIEAVQEQTALATEVQEQVTQSTLRILDTASLMRAYYIREWTDILPQLRAEEAPTAVPRLLRITTEEEAMTKRVPLGFRMRETQEIERWIQLRPEERTAEVERLELEPQAILMVDNVVQAMMERLLWETRQAQVQECMQELMAMSEEKRRYIIPIVGLEPLQKLLMTYYVPYYMEQPYCHNMLGIVLSLMTLQDLAGKSVSIYASLSAQGQAIKQKAEIISATVRVLRTKAVALSKRMGEWWQTVHGLAETVNLEVTKRIPLFTDYQGKPIYTVLLFQVLTFRYLLSEYFAKHAGFPENKWYMTYPRIEVIVTRRGLKIHRRLAIPEAQLVRFNRDEYLKNIRKWRGTHG